MRVFRIIKYLALIFSPLVQGQSDRLMVIGGFTSQGVDTADVEMIDMSASGLTCVKPADFPLPTESGVVALVTLINL